MKLFRSVFAVPFELGRRPSRQKEASLPGLSPSQASHTHTHERRQTSTRRRILHGSSSDPLEEKYLAFFWLYFFLTRETDFSCVLSPAAALRAVQRALAAGASSRHHEPSESHESSQGGLLGRNRVPAHALDPKRARAENHALLGARSKLGLRHRGKPAPLLFASRAAPGLPRGPTRAHSLFFVLS